jgi:drug/metabolite transporter (DMT)-like permease
MSSVVLPDWLRRSVWLGLLPAAALLVLLIAPLGRLVLAGWAGDVSLPAAAATEAWSLWSPWQDDYLRWRVLWSLAQAGITCVLAFALGLPLAWVLLYTAPLWVLIGSVSLGWLRPTVRAVTLVLLATGGVALTAAAGGEGVTVSAAAVAWGLAAGLSYASYYLVGRTLVETLGPIRTYAIAMIIGGLALVPFADLEWPTREVAGLLAVLALASTLLAYLLLGVGLTRISSTRASVIATAEPVVATVMAVAVAGERPGPLAYVGGVLVVGSALAAGLGPLDGATVPKQAPYPVPTSDPSPDPSPKSGAQSAP